MPCTGLQVMIDEQRRLYRLLDAALNGTTYTAVDDGWGGTGGGGGGSWGGGGGGGGSWGGGSGGGGSWGGDGDANYTYDGSTGYIITPPLPPAPPSTPAIAPGLRARFERLVALSDNQATGRTYTDDTQNPAEPDLTDAISVRQTLRDMQGIINAGWFGIGGTRATVADVVNALRVGSDGQRDTINTALQDLLNAGGDVAQIIATVQGLFDDIVDNAGEGAILTTLLVSTLAAATANAQAASQLQRIIDSLDGGGLSAPATNVIERLTEIKDAVQ